MTAIAESAAGQAVERAADLFAQLADYQREGVRRGIPEVLAEIYRTRAWAALGHDTFDTACDALFGGWRIALPAEDRRAVVAELRDEGMSTRAIASVVGVHHSTVAGDIATVGNPTVDEPSAPATIVGLDGRRRAATRPTPPRPEPVADPAPRPPVVIRQLPREEVEARETARRDEEQRRLEIAAKQAAVAAWGQAAGGLLRALSYAKSGYRPPDPMPSGYTTAAEFGDWLRALADAVEEWQ